LPIYWHYFFYIYNLFTAASQSKKIRQHTRRELRISKSVNKLRSGGVPLNRPTHSGSGPRPARGARFHRPLLSPLPASTPWRRSTTKPGDQEQSQPGLWGGLCLRRPAERAGGKDAGDYAARLGGVGWDRPRGLPRSGAGPSRRTAAQ